MVPASSWLGDPVSSADRPNWYQTSLPSAKGALLPERVSRLTDLRAWSPALTQLTHVILLLLLLLLPLTTGQSTGLMTSGDIETNPGPRTTYTCILCDRRIKEDRQTSIECHDKTRPHWIHQTCSDTRLKDYTEDWTCKNHRHKETKQTDKHNKIKKDLQILQININGLRTKIDELQVLVTKENIDIVTIQETKLKKTFKTPTLQNFTTVRTDRDNKDGGGLITYIKDDITFTEIKTPQLINKDTTELQHIRLHLSTDKKLDLFNIYIPPRQGQHNDNDISNCFRHILNHDRTILLGDINAHDKLWYSPTPDHRGQLIADLITNSQHIVLNKDTPTRVPMTQGQRPTSPDITTATDEIHRHVTWNTLTALSSDHLPIKIRLNTKTNFRLTQHRHCYTNYNKANWTEFTNYIDKALEDATNTNDIHKDNKTLTNLILEADKLYIPKGKINNKKTLLPEHIRLQIDERDELRTEDPTNNRIDEMTTNIRTAINKHKTELFKQHLDGNWDHRSNTHILWKTINGLTNKKPKTNTNCTITFNNTTAETDKQKADNFTKQFTNITKHKTNRKIIRDINKLKTEQITITLEQVQKALKATKNNNSTGPDNINIKHLKHLGPIALQFLTDIYNNSLNKNIIPQIWKTAKIIPIPKPNKDTSLGTSYRPISLLSPIAKLLEKTILPNITLNIENNPNQHGFKAKHSTSTALHTIVNHITTGFNQKIPPHRTITVALDMSKAFDMVNLYILLRKIQNTNIPNIIIQYLANYLRGRKAYTHYNNADSAKKQFKTGVPQGGVLSPTLFNIYTSDIPTPPDKVHNTTYADDMTAYSSDAKYKKAEERLQPYLDELSQWTKDNDLKLNPTKTQTTLFTPDPAEYSVNLNLTIDDTRLPMERHPTILGLTLDPKMTFNQHVTNMTYKARKTIKVLKALTSTQWGKDKETLLNTYKTVTRPVLEYASTVWSPMLSEKQTNRLQIVQNSALRVATGCTADTEITHLHDETNVLPIKDHLRLHSSQLRQQVQHPDHTLHRLTRQPKQKRYKKQTTFDNNNSYTMNLDTNPDQTNDKTIKENMKTIHTRLVDTYLRQKPKNPLLNDNPPDIDQTEEALPRMTRRRLAQLRIDRSPLLRTYLHKTDPDQYPTDKCPLCKTKTHDTRHLFDCKKIPTDLTTTDLWTRPTDVAVLLDRWGREVGWPLEGSAGPRRD